MTYETLCEELNGLEKELTDTLKAAQKLMKNAEKATAIGDLKTIRAGAAALSQTAQKQAASIEALQSAIDGFDAREYFMSGDFAAQLLEACESRGINVKGSAPVFEMFPYRVRIDMEAQEVWLDRKKMTGIRPAALAETIRASREKLMSAAFNAEAFADELADAYDIVCMKEGKNPGADIYLSSIYKVLVPMGRFRKEYGQQEFAFDLARLYSAHPDASKKGRRFSFGPSRVGSKAIRVLDTQGHEVFLTTVSFYG